MPDDFAALSGRGQVRRLTALARSALGAYSLGNGEVRLAPLSHGWNTTFRVFAPDGGRYVLRVHSARQTVGAVGSEMAWLVALRRDTPLTVPEPVPNTAGELVTQASAPGVPGPAPRFCTLLGWVEGRFFGRGLTPSHLFQVGALTARLHEHAAGWARPAGFLRGRVDNLDPSRRDQGDDNFDPARAAAHAVHTVAAAHPPEAAAVVAEAIRRVWAVQQTLGQEPGVFGLIHGDLHQWNYLFHRGAAAGAIDFDDCGFGHYLYDLAVTLNLLRARRHPGYAVLRPALLAGYRSVRALSPEHESLLDTFLALRQIQDVVSLTAEREDATLRDTWHSLVTGELNALRTFVETA